MKFEDMDLDQQELHRKKSSFCVGDRVRIVQKIVQQPGWRNSWVGGMDRYIGAEGTITAMDIHGVCLKEVPNYRWPPLALELIE